MYALGTTELIVIEVALRAKLDLVHVSKERLMGIGARNLDS